MMEVVSSGLDRERKERKEGSAGLRGGAADGLYMRGI